MTHVLIMDDSKTARGMVRRVLSMAGFPVGELYEAQDGAEGLAMLATHPIGLVLMDLHMPVMDGEAFLQLVSSNPRWNGLPIVILSTERNRARLDTLLAAPGRRYLAKPFRPEALRAVLDELFTTPKEEAATHV